jgi:hypothetical protein
MLVNLLAATADETDPVQVASRARRIWRLQSTWRLFITRDSDTVLLSSGTAVSYINIKNINKHCLQRKSSGGHYHQAKRIKEGKT